MTSSSWLFLALPLVLATLAEAGDQSIGAFGILMCGGKPLVGTTVKLWELDTLLNPDDLLMEVKTDSEGKFKVNGTENEIFSIEPVVKFYHRCKNPYHVPFASYQQPNEDNKIRLKHFFKVCQRKNVYKIPKSYITKGKTPSKWYDFGVLNMDAKQKDEGTKCL